MATYHLRAKTISRGRSQSAVAAAAYRSGERLVEAATGAVKHYPARSDRVVFAGIYAPAFAPAWARDRTTLWNAVERIERRKDATLAREIELSLPHEMTDRQRQWLVQDFIRENLTRRGLVVDVAIHAPERGGDPRNHHAHLLIVERQFGPGGFARVKDRSLSGKAVLYGWRANWAQLVNRHLERHGYGARVDHRSLKAQGIDRRPTKPRSRAAAIMQRRGMGAPRGEGGCGIQGREGLRRAGREVACQQREPAPVLSARQHGWSAGQGHRNAVEGPTFRVAASGLTAPPMPSFAVPRVVATAVEQVAPESMAKEVCRRPAAVIDALAAVRQAAGDNAEPCSYEAEVAGIMAQFAMRIEGIRRSNLPREQMQAAVRAVMNEQRAAVAGVRERRRWISNRMRHHAQGC